MQLRATEQLLQLLIKLYTLFQGVIRGLTIPINRRVCVHLTRKQLVYIV
jgi:hypothetical protein